MNVNHYTNWKDDGSNGSNSFKSPENSRARLYFKIGIKYTHHFKLLKEKIKDC